MSPTDAALLDRWCNHRDAEAFAEIVARHLSMVYHTCRRILGDTHDAEDVAQECFTDLVRNPPRKRKDLSSLGGWLYTVATRRV